MTITKEQLLVQYLLQHPEYLETTSSSLLQGEYHAILQEMKRQIHNGIKPTKGSIELALRDTGLPIEWTDEVPDDSTYRIILEELQPRAVKNLLLQIQGKLYAEDQMSQKEIKKLHKDLTDLQTIPEIQFRNSIDFTDFDKHILPNKPHLNTEFEFLRRNDAEPRINDLVTFMAPTNGGKSLFQMSIARGMWQNGYNVMYIGMEETTDQLAQRLGCGLFDMTAQQYKALTPEGIRRRYDEAEHHLQRQGKRLGNFKMVYATASTTTVESIVEMIQTTEKETGVKYDAVFIDYAGVVTVQDKALYKRHDEIQSRVFERLKAAAINLEKVIFTAVQSNRQGFAGDLDLDNMADSLGGARNADMVLGVWREQSQLPTDAMTGITEDQLLGFFNCKVLKSRTSTLTNGTQVLFRALKTQRIQEMNIPLPADDLTNETVTDMFNGRL